MKIAIAGTTVIYGTLYVAVHALRFVIQAPWCSQIHSNEDVNYYKRKPKTFYESISFTTVFPKIIKWRFN